MMLQEMKPMKRIPWKMLNKRHNKQTKNLIIGQMYKAIQKAKFLTCSSVSVTRRESFHNAETIPYKSQFGGPLDYFIELKQFQGLMKELKFSMKLMKCKIS